VIPVAAIFDIGKTNKKFILFDERYSPVYEVQEQLPEILDEDGFPGEDIEALTAWVKQALRNAVAQKDFWIRAINFSAYGASLVHLDAEGKILTPLYNYLKPYPSELENKFSASFGDVSAATASPALGNLNTGLQLYRLKHERPDLFSRIRYALHLPQYLSYCVTGRPFSELTSLGCHTALWDFKRHDYHAWVTSEEIDRKFAPLCSGDVTLPVTAEGHGCISGIGLHDSSSAIIPYHLRFREPFVLISTGTWSISLNPFNQRPLTDSELKQDCLCYFSWDGVPIKASRVLAGHYHDEQVKRMALHFHVGERHFETVVYDQAIVDRLPNLPVSDEGAGLTESAIPFPHFDAMRTYEEAYHQLMRTIVHHQVISTRWVLQDSGARQLMVDGGFSQNRVYMNLLAKAFPGITVCSARLPQASALGAALVIRKKWNNQPLPADLVQLISRY
jgi:sugar (pentulose or hexulose) kinase